MKKVARVPYTLIPNSVIEDTNLTPTEKVLYFLILKFANKNGYCNASQLTLAHHLNRTDRQVKTLLNKLQKRSLIEKHSPSSFKSTNTYIPLVTIEGKSNSPHTGNYYQPSLSSETGNEVPTNSSLKVKVKNMKGELLRKMSTTSK